MKYYVLSLSSKGAWVFFDKYDNLKDAKSATVILTKNARRMEARAGETLVLDTVVMIPTQKDDWIVQVEGVKLRKIKR